MCVVISATRLESLGAILRKHTHTAALGSCRHDISLLMDFIGAQPSSTSSSSLLTYYHYSSHYSEKRSITLLMGCLLAQHIRSHSRCWWSHLIWHGHGARERGWSERFHVISKVIDFFVQRVFVCHFFSIGMHVLRIRRNNQQTKTHTYWSMLCLFLGLRCCIIFFSRIGNQIANNHLLPDLFKIHQVEIQLELLFPTSVSGLLLMCSVAVPSIVYLFFIVAWDEFLCAQREKGERERYGIENLQPKIAHRFVHCQTEAHPLIVFHCFHSTPKLNFFFHSV